MERIHGNETKEEEESTASEDEQEDESISDGDSGTDDGDVQAIGNVLLEIVQEFPNVRSVEGIIGEDYKVIMLEFQSKVQDIVNTAQNIQGTELFQSINQRKKKKMKNDIPEEEAEEAAWDERQFALKHFILGNMEELQELIFTDDDTEV
jgi:hypothetical protein